MRTGLATLIPLDGAKLSESALHLLPLIKALGFERPDRDRVEPDTSLTMRPSLGARPSAGSAALSGRVLRRVVTRKDVLAKVAERVAPDAVRMVGVVLRAVVLD